MMHIIYIMHYYIKLAGVELKERGSVEGGAGIIYLPLVGGEGGGGGGVVMSVIG